VPFILEEGFRPYFLGICEVGGAIEVFSENEGFECSPFNKLLYKEVFADGTAGFVGAVDE